MITVGIDMIPSDIGVAGFSSMSIFKILTFAPSSTWICSTIGAIMRHGPHHVAQKSTNTGMSDLSTELSNSLSVTVCMSDIYDPFLSVESDLDSGFDSDFDSVLLSDLVSGLLSDLVSGLLSELATALLDPPALLPELL